MNLFTYMSLDSKHPITSGPSSKRGSLFRLFFQQPPLQTFTDFSNLFPSFLPIVMTKIQTFLTHAPVIVPQQIFLLMNDLQMYALQSTLSSSFSSWMPAGPHHRPHLKPLIISNHKELFSYSFALGSAHQPLLSCLSSRGIDPVTASFESTELPCSLMNPPLHLECLALPLSTRQGPPWLTSPDSGEMSPLW